MLGVADEIRGNALLFDGGLLCCVLVGYGYSEMRKIAAWRWDGLRTCGGTSSQDTEILVMKRLG